MTTREKIRVGVLLTVLLLLFVASGYRAEATTASIFDEHVCLETGEWQVTWFVTNDDPRPMAVTDQNPVLWPDEIPAKSTFPAQPYRIAGDALGTSAELFVEWGPGEVQNVVGILDLREETCLTVITSSTTTTVGEQTTTTLNDTTTPTTPPTTSTPSSSTTFPTVPPPDDVTTNSVPTPTRIDAGTEPGGPDWTLVLSLVAFGLAAGVLAVLAWRQS